MRKKLLWLSLVVSILSLNQIPLFAVPPEDQDDNSLTTKTIKLKPQPQRWEYPYPWNPAWEFALGLALTTYGTQGIYYDLTDKTVPGPYDNFSWIAYVHAPSLGIGFGLIVSGLRGLTNGRINLDQYFNL